VRWKKVLEEREKTKLRGRLSYDVVDLVVEERPLSKGSIEPSQGAKRLKKEERSQSNFQEKRCFSRGMGGRRYPAEGTVWRKE